MKRALLVLASTTVACGGAAPLMHTAHAIDEDVVTLGAGFSGTLAVDPPALETEEKQVLESGSVSPGLAPWVGGRLGFGGQFDAGLTYTARSIRLDGRRAFHFGSEEQTAVSLGLGVSGLLPKRDDDLASRVGGFGGDVPILVGWRSTADIYSVYAGARGGFELLRGQRDLAELPDDPAAPLVEDVEGWHGHAGGLFGIRIGFRYIFAVFELDAAMHWAQADVGQTEATIRMFTIAPAGALIGKF